MAKFTVMLDQGVTIAGQRHRYGAVVDSEKLIDPMKPVPDTATDEEKKKAHDDYEALTKDVRKQHDAAVKEGFLVPVNEGRKEKE